MAFFVRSFFPSSSFPDELSQRHHFERTVWWSRWLAAALGAALFVLLDDTLLGLSLACLGGLLLHNGFRTWLLHSGVGLVRFRTLSLVCFTLDVGVLLLALIPFLREGGEPVQLLLLLVLVEAVPRFRFEPPRTITAVLSALTLVLVAYELLGLRYHENRGRAVLWSVCFLACGVWATVETQRHRVQWSGALTAMPPPPPVGPVAEPLGVNANPLPVPTPAPPRRSLTPQQQAVLALLPTSLKRREIADRLHLSEETVNSHLQRLYRHLEVTKRADAVTRARELGLLAEDSRDPPA